MAESTQDDLTICFVCKDRLRIPKVLPCLHVFCDSCLNQHRHVSRSTACPMCNFDTSPAVVVERECNFLQTYLKMCNEPPANQTNDENGHVSDSDTVDKESDSRDRLSDSDRDIPERSESVLSRKDESMLLCSSHPQQIAEDFCPSCQKIICQKCMDSLHKRCKEAIPLQEAVEMNILTFNTIHEQLTKVYLETEEKVDLERSKLDVLAEQKQQAKETVGQLREQLVNAILEKEKAMMKEIDEQFDEEMRKVSMTVMKGEALRSCVQRSVDVFECAMSMNGQGELMELEKGLSERAHQYSLACEQLNTGDQEKTVSFVKNGTALAKLEKTVVLGEVVTSTLGKKTNGISCHLNSPWEGKLTLISSFHGGTREDTSDPLLTDVILLNGGDVILTDRDNKCLKKFNSYGKVLTRVPIPDVPSRIAVISHSKIVVTVMNKKLLLFFSIFGTLRILSQIKTKKQYAYITGTEDGNLLVGTSNCDTIDIISQTGQFIRSLYNQKSEKAVISRPLYLTQTMTGHFLVSDSGRRLLFALEGDGSTKFSYKPKGSDALECPLGVVSDVANYALLADRDSNSVHLISPKGELVKKILTEVDSLIRPCGVYISGRITLAVTQVDGYVKVYKAEGV